MSNTAYTTHPHPHAASQTHIQTRGGVELQPDATSLAPKSSHDDLRRPSSTSSQQQQQRTLPPLPPTEQSAHADMPPKRSVPSHEEQPEHRGRKRGRQSPVDWVAYFGGKLPNEIITIHDDDSPAPPASIQTLPPPANDATTSHHVDKKRRTNAGNGEAHFSATNTPYSLSNAASTESLQNTTAPTSLGSSGSSSGRLDATQTGQKRKRTVKAPEPESAKKKATETRGPKGYLAEYGEYVPPKQIKKQKEVHVPAIHDVSIDDDIGLCEAFTDRMG